MTADKRPYEGPKPPHNLAYSVVGRSSDYYCTADDSTCPVVEHKPAQNPAYDAATVVGPDDLLVLVSKRAFTPDDLADLRRRLPESTRDRLIVVDGASFDAYVLPAEKSASSGAGESRG